LVHRSESWVAPHFPLKAADFIKRGIAPGPALGAALHEAEEAWIAADFPANDAAIAAIADAAAAEVRPM
jgi:poly(A) polymerase